MNLYFWNDNNVLNFGDAINLALWPKLFSSTLLDNDEINFLGIGTVLNHLLPQDLNFLVFGSGYGYGKIPLNVKAMDIYCVRGPLTVQKLGLSPDKSVTDPAILLPTIIAADRTESYKFGFMPHWRNSCPIWEKICDENEILYIDPLDSFSNVITKINSIGCLITEAMHGAVVADSYRIPWIPVYDEKNPDHSMFKWMDWTASMELNTKFTLIPHIQDDQSHNILIQVLEKAMKSSFNLSKSKIVHERVERLQLLINKLEANYNL
jgi:succinoglycan biosynthesis protein ExoV